MPSKVTASSFAIQCSGSPTVLVLHINAPDVVYILTQSLMYINALDIPDKNLVVSGYICDIIANFLCIQGFS